MTGLDPIKQGQKVCARVYEKENNTRLVDEFRLGKYYGGCTTLDVIGCNYLCSYCWRDVSVSTAKGKLFNSKLKKKRVVAMRPYELYRAYLETIRKKDWPLNIHITGGEFFLTPGWAFRVVQTFYPWLKLNNALMHIDTNGFYLVKDIGLIKKLKPYRDALRLFVSSKNWPAEFLNTARVDPLYSDIGFEALDLLWRNKFHAYLQAPITALFFPESFEWYFERLYRVHPMAPLFLYLDKMRCLPAKRTVKKLKRSGMWDRRQSHRKIEKLWKEFLEFKYGRGLTRLLSINGHYYDQFLVEQYIHRGFRPSIYPLFKPIMSI